MDANAHVANASEIIAGTCTWGARNLQVFWIPLIVSCIGGAVGGIAECLTHLKLSATGLMFDGAKADREAFRSFVRVSAWIGLAGAVGVLFVFVATRWWQEESKTDSLPLFVLTLSVAAGFGARRLLPHLTRRLEQQIKEVGDEAKDAKVESGIAQQVAKEAEGKAEQAKEEAFVSQIIARSLATLNEGEKAPPNEVFECIEAIGGLLGRRPMHRTANIVLGRLLNAAGDLVGAIDALDRFIEAKNSSGQLDGDLADALFNRACYHVKVWQEAGAEPSADGLKYRKQRALEDLKESFKLKPKNIHDAQTDPDLKPLWQDHEFLALIQLLTKS
jgi:hypothetical protein